MINELNKSKAQIEHKTFTMSEFRFVLKLKHMPKFQIQKLAFNSLNDWIELQGNIVKGFLKSEYTIKIDVSQINRILNAIQSINPNQSIYDFYSSHTQNEYSEYRFDFDKLEGRELSFSELKDQASFDALRMIRA